VILGCAALQALQAITDISLQLRLGKGVRGGVVTGLKCKKEPYVRADPLSQLLLCIKTEAINPDVFSTICLWKQIEREKLQYLQAVSLVLETSQGSLETQRILESATVSPW